VIAIISTLIVHRRWLKLAPSEHLAVKLLASLHVGHLAFYYQETLKSILVGQSMVVKTRGRRRGIVPLPLSRQRWRGPTAGLASPCSSLFGSL
jgi:hypothetical protein